MDAMDALPIVCTLTDEEMRQRRGGLLRQVRERVAAWERLPAGGGVLLRVKPGKAALADLCELIRLESECCAFLRFRLTVEPGEAALALEISGPPGAADLLAGELVELS